MKKARSIIALVVILLLLSGAYVYVSKHPKNIAADDKAATATGLSPVWKIDGIKVTKIIVTYSGGVNTFVKSTKEWAIENYAYKLDQTILTSVTDSLINLTGTLVEKNAKDMGKYGLDKPTINVKVVGDGTDKILIIGDKTSDAASYYVREKDKTDVYFISLGIVESIIAKQSVYRDKTIAVIDEATLSDMKISQAGNSPIDISRNSSQSADETKFSLNTWIVTGGYSQPIGADDQKIATVTAAIPNLKVSDIVEDNPKDLSVYGLDKPSLDLTLKDAKSTLHLLIGKDKDDSSVYFKIAGASTIYTMDKTVINLFRVKSFDIITKFAYIVNIDNVEKIVIDSKGSKDTVVISRTSAKSTKAGDPDVVTTAAKVNDKDIEISKFKTQYQEIIGLTTDAENDKKLEDKPEVRITYTLNKGTKKQEIVDFAPYNDEFYAVFRDGKSYFVISKAKVSTMIADLKNLK